LNFAGWTTGLIAAAGCLLAALGLRAGGVRGWRCLRHALGFGPGLGLGLVSLYFFFKQLVGLDQPGLGELLLVTAGSASALVAWQRWRPPSLTDAAPGAAREPLALRATAVLALLLTGAGLLVSYRVLSTSWPDGTWDAVAIWNVRARFLERADGSVPELLKAIDRTSHPNYPLLLPGAVATQLVLAGEDDSWVPEVTGLAFLIGLGLLTFAVVADSGLLAYSALATALLWGTPMLLKWGGAQCADLPLSYFFLGALAVLAAQIPGRAEHAERGPARLSPLLGGVFLGLLAWTKNEGVLMALTLLGLYAVWTWRFVARGRERWRPLAGFAFGALPGMAAVFLFKHLWAPESGLHTFLQGGHLDHLLSPERWWIPTREILSRLAPVSRSHGWGLVWPALELGLLLACVLHWRARRPWASFWGAVLLTTVLCWIPIYVSTPYDQRWHIEGSLDRLLLQLYPAVICGVFLRLGVAASRRPAA